MTSAARAALAVVWRLLSRVVMRLAVAIVAQVAALLLINQAGYAVARLFHLPVPGNLLGMLFLLALLVTGVLPLRWIEASAQLLIRHLAFFFIPITVGLMGFPELFWANGPAIVATLVLSAVLGICVAGLCAQTLASRGRRKSS